MKTQQSIWILEFKLTNGRWMLSPVDCSDVEGYLEHKIAKRLSKDARLRCRVVEFRRVTSKGKAKGKSQKANVKSEGNS